jgi:flagellar hook-associated protein 2
MNDFDSYMRNVTIDGATKRLTDYTDRMYELERKYVLKEERLWNKYTAMEKALASMQSQMDWMAQQFGGMS